MAFGEVVIRYNRLPKLEGALRREVQRIVEDSATECMNKAKELARHKSGTLRRSIHAEPDSGSGGLTWTVGTDVEYARQREFGGTIVPVRAEYLAWKDKKGDWHFAKSVYQPPRPFMTPAAEAVRPVFMRRMRDAVEKAAR